MARQLIRLLEPDLCLTCRFNNGSKLVQTQDGESYNAAVNCTRGDCDNWDHSIVEKLEDQDGA